jgi:hypothetical protein
MVWFHKSLMDMSMLWNGHGEVLHQCWPVKNKGSRVKPFIINTQPQHDFLSKPASLSISSSSNFASTTSGQCDYYGNDRAHPCYTRCKKGKNKTCNDEK